MTYAGITLRRRSWSGWTRKIKFVLSLCRKAATSKPSLSDSVAALKRSVTWPSCDLHVTCIRHDNAQSIALCGFGLLVIRPGIDPATVQGYGPSQKLYCEGPQHIGASNYWLLWKNKSRPTSQNIGLCVFLGLKMHQSCFRPTPPASSWSSRAPYKMWRQKLCISLTARWTSTELNTLQIQKIQKFWFNEEFNLI